MLEIFGDETTNNGYSQVSGAQHVGVFRNERTNLVENIIDTEVGMEGELSRAEGEDGAVSSSTAVRIFSAISCNKKYVFDAPQSGRNSNGVMEHETKSSVSSVAAFFVKQVLCQILNNREQSAARLVHSGVHSIGTKSALGSKG